MPAAVWRASFCWCMSRSRMLGRRLRGHEAPAARKLNHRSCCAGFLLVYSIAILYSLLWQRQPSTSTVQLSSARAGQADAPFVRQQHPHPFNSPLAKGEGRTATTTESGSPSTSSLRPFDRLRTFSKLRAGRACGMPELRDEKGRRVRRATGPSLLEFPSPTGRGENNNGWPG